MTAVKALATTEDRASMVRGVRIALKIAGQRALRQHQRAVHLAPASDSETDVWDFVKRRSPASIASRDRILREVEDSLRRRRTEYIDTARCGCPVSSWSWSPMVG